MDKRQLLLNKKMLLASIMLSTALLNGCSNRDTLTVNSSTITYEDNSRHGSILFDDLEHVLIMNLKKDSIEYTKLVYMALNKENFTLYDLETGKKLEGYDVVSSEGIVKYVLLEDSIKFDYEISEIINIYHNLLDDSKIISTR